MKKELKGDAPEKGAAITDIPKCENRVGGGGEA